MIRPQPLAFMPGIAAFMPWNTPDMLMAMIWSHFSSGNSSTGAVNWMPALLTRISSDPSDFWVSATIAAICAPLLMSAPLYSAFTPNRCSSETLSSSIFAAIAEAIQHDRSPVRRQGFGDAQSDPAGRSGHQRDLSLETHGDVLFQTVWCAAI